MKSERYQKALIKANSSIKDAVKQMDSAAMQVLIVIDDKQRLLGIVTDGDIRRAVIKGLDFSKLIDTIMTKDPITLTHPSKKGSALKLMHEKSIKHIPLINNENKVIGIFLWEDFLNERKIRYSPQNAPVVIMAGGKGTRLDPFTKILPKPLIPIGEKPIIIHIINNFYKFGFNDFIISLNYKGDMIKAYLSENIFDDQKTPKISYIMEKRFLGTAGSLTLAKTKLNSTFILSNCDVIINADFDKLLKYHKKHHNHITILGVLRQLKIPYGILEMKNKSFSSIIEKPEYQYIVNSGIYVLEPDILDLFAANTVIDMTNLLSKAKEKKLKIQVYPMSCNWFDIGEWEEYRNAITHIKNIGID